MSWPVVSLFLLSTFKFMFTPFGGPGLGLSFFETYFACISGGIVSAAVFYYSAEYFMLRAKRKRILQAKAEREHGERKKRKKTFTKLNKTVVKIKRSIGIIGISFWVPFFLSIPLGSIVVAKFYGDQKKTFPLVVLGLCINGFITTSLAYIIYG